MFLHRKYFYSLGATTRLKLSMMSHFYCCTECRYAEGRHNKCHNVEYAYCYYGLPTQIKPWCFT